MTNFARLPTWADAARHPRSATRRTLFGRPYNGRLCTFRYVRVRCNRHIRAQAQHLTKRGHVLDRSAPAALALYYPIWEDRSKLLGEVGSEDPLGLLVELGNV